MPSPFKNLTLTLTLLGLSCLQSFAQHIDSLQGSPIDCTEYNGARAQADIKKGEAVLFIRSGSIVTYSNEKKLAKKYHFTIANKGCLPWASDECMLAYNQAVFEYLDKTYGTAWRKDVRKDIIGFPE